MDKVLDLADDLEAVAEGGGIVSVDELLREFFAERTSRSVIQSVFGWSFHHAKTVPIFITLSQDSFSLLELCWHPFSGNKVASFCKMRLI